MPVSSHTFRGLRSYLSTSHPRFWLFIGKVRGQQLSRASVRHAFRSVLLETGTQKQACVHTLRYSYAIHLLEMEQDILSV